LLACRPPLPDVTPELDAILYKALARDVVIAASARSTVMSNAVFVVGATKLHVPYTLVISNEA
jgi:hypothetical protein